MGFKFLNAFIKIYMYKTNKNYYYVYIKKNFMLRFYI